MSGFKAIQKCHLWDSCVINSRYSCYKQQMNFKGSFKGSFIVSFNAYLLIRRFCITPGEAFVLIFSLFLSQCLISLLRFSVKARYLWSSKSRWFLISPWSLFTLRMFTWYRAKTKWWKNLVDFHLAMKISSKIIVTFVRVKLIKIFCNADLILCHRRWNDLIMQFKWHEKCSRRE